MLRGSFDQALWPQAFAVRAIKLAVCLHSHLLFGPAVCPRHFGHSPLLLWGVQACPLLLGRSSLPIASLQTLKIRGSFDQALWPQAFAVRAIKLG